MTRKILMAFGVVTAGIAVYFALGFFTPDANPPLLGNAVGNSEQSVEIMPEPTILEAPVVMEPVSASDRSNAYDTVTVSFATNRQFDPAAPFDEQFGTERGDLIYGEASVSIPPNHERGMLEQQNWFVSFIFEPNPEKHILVQDLTVLDRADILNLIAEQASEDDRAVLAYIHGYNTSFDKAARRMGQMSNDLKWGGASFFFSWPSDGGFER